MTASPFLHAGGVSQEDQLAILYLRRDQVLSTILRQHDDQNLGYQEGKVINTRFGSFPHSTLIKQPWGSQIRASTVDTGTRGRKGLVGQSDGPHGRKRKRGGLEATVIVQDDVSCELPSATTTVDGDITARPALKTAIEAPSGFVHLLPPTPESWTTSLPHRTQVVYTPDYSYILHRLQARPGTRLIEAGAGSGSFTHASARSVYSGPSTSSISPSEVDESIGQVFSFEFHQERARALQKEIESHGLTDLVKLTWRDVYADGFRPSTIPTTSVRASAIFLDLPAPWLTIPHLNRLAVDSPLHPDLPIHLCSFSPCIEQVDRMVTKLRQSGWIEVEMVRVDAKQIETRRERIGLAEYGVRGVDDSPASVDEAILRLLDVDARTHLFHLEGKLTNEGKPALDTKADPTVHHSKQDTNKTVPAINTPAFAQALVQAKQAADGYAAQLATLRQGAHTEPSFAQGRRVTRDEQDLKSHTSYLVFAILPRAWSAGDEAKAQQACAAAVANRKGS